MNRIPLFDSITHPTLNGNWILPRYKGVSSLNNLLTSMNESNIKWCLAVGMEGIGDYSPNEYASMLKNHRSYIIPIAYVNPRSAIATNISKYLTNLASMGYRGIKLHPRFGNFLVDDLSVSKIIIEANRAGLVPLLCTYFYGDKIPSCRNSISNVINLLTRIGDAKLVLLHGGGVRIIEMMEVARTFPNVLLDLSLTICKYEGSSIDNDIKYLFNKFDRRISIGSDYPEFPLKELRNRFEYFAASLDTVKAVNIANRNLRNYFCV